MLPGLFFVLLLVLALAGYLGYLAVNYLVKPGKTPPLVPALGMAAMYLGTAESIFMTLTDSP